MGSKFSLQKGCVLLFSNMFYNRLFFKEELFMALIFDTLFKTKQRTVLLFRLWLMTLRKNIKTWKYVYMCPLNLAVRITNQTYWPYWTLVKKRDHVLNSASKRCVGVEVYLHPFSAGQWIEWVISFVPRRSTVSRIQ